MSDSNTLHISGEVGASLSNNNPIVALESTVIAHGLPRPTNLETARKLETVVSEAGATPATIAIIDGQPHIGLNDEQLELLATSRDIKKVSIRDLSIALAQKPLFNFYIMIFMQ